MTLSLNESALIAAARVQFEENLVRCDIPRLGMRTSTWEELGPLQERYIEAMRKGMQAYLAHEPANSVSDLTLAQHINAAISSVYPKMRLRYGDLSQAIIKALRAYLVNTKPMDMEMLRAKIEKEIAPMLAEKVIELVRETTP